LFTGIKHRSELYEETETLKNDERQAEVDLPSVQEGKKKKLHKRFG
jgi:hypothetical protein